MKEIGVDTTQRIREHTHRARQVSALASKKSKGLGNSQSPDSIAYLARHINYGSSFDHSFGTRPTNSTVKKLKNSSGSYNFEQAKSQSDLIPFGEINDPRFNLSMDVGGMQLNEPAILAASN